MDTISIYNLLVIFTSPTHLFVHQGRNKVNPSRDTHACNIYSNPSFQRTAYVLWMGSKLMKMSKCYKAFSLRGSQKCSFIFIGSVLLIFLLSANVNLLPDHHHVKVNRKQSTHKKWNEIFKVLQATFYKQCRLWSFLGLKRRTVFNSAQLALNLFWFWSNFARW